MCDRYFIEFPPQEPLTPESLLKESLALVSTKDIQLHKVVFFMPFEPVLQKLEKKSLKWPRADDRDEAGAVLRQNIRFMINKTKHFGLLLSQLTWVGLMNFAEKRRVLQQTDDNLRAAALYIIMLKKDASGLTQFLNCLHMTGNHEIANIIEAKLELLVVNDGICEYYGECVGFEESLEECHGHFLPPKKRKTSADSGFDDSDDDEQDEVESSFAAGAPKSRPYKCHIRPLDAVDVIAIINGKEDSRSKVELCKCGHYHQFPKWKDVNNANVKAKENKVPNESGLKKYFTRKTSTSELLAVDQQQGILSPVPQPVEVGTDLSFGESDCLEFTRPRRSCTHLRLRFNSNDSFIEHPDNVQGYVTTSTSEEKRSTSLKNKLPRFLRIFV